MYSPFNLAIKYLHYYFTASNSRGHGIHSPFVFDFVRNVLNDKKEYDAYLKVEPLRSRLLSDHSVVEVDDLGAGSRVSTRRRRTVSDIASSAAKPKKYAQLLYRIVQYYNCETIIELGASLGLTTSYLALANNRASVFTLEGAHAIAELAENNFRQLAIHNIALTTGNFDDSLPELLRSISTVDCCFIDGNHRKGPTLDYFYRLSERINTGSILIFDDIHWSKDMEEAWEMIKNHPGVRLSIDLFFVGLVFFGEEFKTKQHFIIRY